MTSLDGDHDDPALRDIAAGLRERAPAFEAAVCEAISRRPSYTGLDPEAIRPAVRRHIHTLVDHFAEAGRTMSAVDDEFFRSMGEQRAQQGVAIHDLVQIWHLLISLLRKDLLARADDHATSTMVAALRTIDRLDAGLLAMVAGYQAVDSARRPAWSRTLDSAALRVLTDPSRPAAEIRAVLDGRGFPREAEVFVSRTRPVGDQDRALALTWAERAADPALCGLLDGDLCVVTTRPMATDGDRTIARAGPVPASALPDALRRAYRALQVALRLGLTGPTSLADLGVLPALVADDDVGQGLRRRYVDPVLAASPSGDAVLDTVEEFLRQDLKLAPTARALHLHVNTVRYRVARFEEVVGAGVRDSERMVEIWWALRRRRLT